MEKPFAADGAFADNIRAELPADDTELRQSMKAYGWNPEFPALADEHGVILVGHRRMKIAASLKIEPVIKTLYLGNGDAADAERVKIALISNIGAKPLTAKDRKYIAMHLYGRDEWTMQRIAKALNVSVGTVSGDLADFSAPEKSNRKKTAANPKGSGRRKGTKKQPSNPTRTEPTEPTEPTPRTSMRGRGPSPKLDAAREIVRAMLEADEPISPHKLQEEHDISHVTFDMAITAEVARRDALEEQATGLLSASAREKFDVAIRAHKKKLDSEFNSRVEREVIEWGKTIKFPQMEKYLADAKRVMESRKGVMPGAVYRLIERCLHPDNTASEDVRNKAFVAFQELKPILTSQSDSPIAAPPLGSFADMMAKREAKRRENSERSKAAHAKRASTNGTVSR